MKRSLLYLAVGGVAGLGALVVRSLVGGRTPQKTIASSEPRTSTESRSEGRVALLVPDPATFPDHGAYAPQIAIAERSAGVRATQVASGGAVLAAIRLLRPIQRLVIIGHANPTSILRPGVWGVRVGASAQPAWASVDELAREIAASVVQGGVVSIAGCRAGANPEEVSWGPTSFQNGGATSFAAQLRDALARLGWNGSVRARAARGSALVNPTGRVFLTSAPGRPGVAISARADTHSQEALIRWTLGGSL